MKKTAIILTAFAMLLFVAGCSSMHKMEQPKSFAESLYAAKNPYIGNNSADADLVSLMRLGNFGKYTLSVEAKEHPYTLSIRYMYLNSSVDREKFNTTMTNSAILLLALIDNCEQISWTYASDEGQQSNAIGVDYVKDVMEIDVKNIAKDEKKFTELCNQLFPDRATTS